MMTQVFTGRPTITTHPTSQLTNVSMSVTLDCEGTGRGSITYHWTTKQINKRWMKINNSNNKRYVVRNLEQSQQYRCVVSNEAGSTRSNVATITLLSKLYICQCHAILILSCITEIITQPNSSVTVVALQDLPLSCLASVDNVVYSWHRVGGTIPSRSQGQSSNTFIIPRVTPHDEGMYFCVATKVGVIVESNRATVRVDGENTLCNSNKLIF